jgi:hypothetical protein
MSKNQHFSFKRAATKYALYVVLIITTQSMLPFFAHGQQRKQTNWIEEKKSHITRWRIGVGANGVEPLGANIQLYKLKGICSQTIRIKKKLSLDLSLSKEGYVVPQLINGNNNWEKGGLRLGLDFRFYFSTAFFSPYIGVGVESGTRVFDNQSNIHSDFVGRVGVESKLIGIRTSSKSLFHMSYFIEGKYNYGLNSSFSYISPTFGLRAQFL